MELKNNVSTILNIKHLAITVSNVSIVCVLFMVAVLTSHIFSALAIGVAFIFLFAFLLFATVVSVGLVYLIDGFSNLWSWFGVISEGGSEFLELIGKLYVVFPYIAAIGAVLSATSVICLSFCKEYKSVPRIVIGVIVLIISIFSLIFMLAGGLEL